MEGDGPHGPKTGRSEKSSTEWSQTNPSPHSTRASTLACAKGSLLRCLCPKKQKRRLERLGRCVNKTSARFLIKESAVLGLVLALLPRRIFLCEMRCRRSEFRTSRKPESGAECLTTAAQEKREREERSETRGHLLCKRATTRSHLVGTANLGKCD